jgi:N6-adenosine-specific RNA methylase IME4
MKQYQTILVDPPWEQPMMPILKRRPKTVDKLPYPTMTMEEIKALPVNDLAGDNCHLWLWTTNRFLHDAFHVVDAWGFRYMQVITWVKKSGCGIYWVATTQPLLFAYKGKCKFPLSKLKPTHFITDPPRIHSRKPEASFELIESISPAPRIELFSRARRFGWDCWGNEVDSDISLGAVQVGAARTEGTL